MRKSLRSIYFTDGTRCPADFNVIKRIFDRFFVLISLIDSHHIALFFAATFLLGGGGGGILFHFQQTPVEIVAYPAACTAVRQPAMKVRAPFVLFDLIACNGWNLCKCFVFPTVAM